VKGEERRGEEKNNSIFRRTVHCATHVTAARVVVSMQTCNSGRYIKKRRKGVDFAAKR